MDFYTKKFNPEDISESVSLKLYLRLFDLDKEYPNFKDWFFNNALKDKNKYIILSYNKEINTGIMVLKDSEKEKKICTLRIYPEYQKMTVGSKLLEYSFDLLKTKKPLITVSDIRLPEYRRILEKYEFELKGIYYDYYIQGHKEYSFNGYLK